MLRNSRVHDSRKRASVCWGGRRGVDDDDGPGLDVANGALDGVVEEEITGEESQGVSARHVRFVHW